MLACDAFPMCAKVRSLHCRAGLPSLSFLPFPALIFALLFFPFPRASSTLITIGWQAVNDLRLYAIWLSALLQVRPEGSRSELARRVEQILSWVV
jgi:hypothetical protein